jgi:hypothetical protein
MIYVLVMFMDGMPPRTPTTELPAQAPEAMERRGRHLRMLAELAEIGMELAREVRLQAVEAAPPGRVIKADPVVAFARLGKAVRQTLALESKVAAGGFDGPFPVSRSAAQPDGAYRPWDSGTKATVRRSVVEAIASSAEAGDAEDLLRDLNERLDDPEYGDEMSDRPIGMAVALICEALGVEVDLKDFTDAEMGFDTEAMKSPDRTFAGSALDLASRAGSVGRGGAARHDPPFVSRRATEASESRAETDVRFTGRPEPDD